MKKAGSDVWRYRVRVPADILERVRGAKISLEVGGVTKAVRVQKEVGCSLGTRDPDEAARRNRHVDNQVKRYWDAVRDGPQRLSNKKCYALAGEVFADWVEVLDEDPGSPEMWQHVLTVNAAVKAPSPYESLTVGSPSETALAKRRALLKRLEERFGGFADVALRRRGLLIDAESRGRLLDAVAAAMDHAAGVNLRKAEGDYAEDGSADRYPTFEEGRPKATGPTLLEVVEKEWGDRASGRTKKPMPDSTLRKYTRVAREFSEFRESGSVGTITAMEADTWVRDMVDEGHLSNNTIAQRLANLKVIVGWARDHSLGNEFVPLVQSLQAVKPPQKNDDVPEGERTFKLDEARRVLRAARGETKPERRWLPWLCAYSGARISEVAQLETDDFRTTEGVDFYILRTGGGRTLKSVGTQRRVPLHSDLIAEGLLEFVAEQRRAGGGRMFPRRSQGNVCEWIRKGVGITREELQPNHGWRHLF
ncbi:MAG: DUF6538 domain-containing protein [Pseudomonadota bacterium]